MKRTWASLAAVTVLLFAAGCAVQGPPTAEIESSQAALRRAIQAGAAQAAPDEIALAREKLELMHRWMQARDYKPARWLAEQAQVDAELASIKAMAAKGRQ